MNQTYEHVRQTNLAAIAERLNGPEMVQTQRATRYPDGANIDIGYCKIDAPASEHITCFLNYDGTDPAVWSHKAWVVGDTVVGDDTSIYRCTTRYTATDDTTKPGVAGQEAVWGAKWVVIEEIEVYCDISGGGNLSDASRQLMAMQKSLGYDDLILASLPEEWSAKWWAVGKVVIGTNSKEHYGCLIAHQGTVDNRPCSGDDWETYWGDPAKVFADKLKITKINGVWEAIEGFRASWQGSFTAP